MTSDKISRKKLLEEPDEFLSLTQRAWGWATENRSKAIAAVGAVVALVLAGVAGVTLAERSRAARSQELAEAVESYRGGEGGAAAGRLEALADRLGSSPQGAVARYFAAGALAAAGERERAAAAYESSAAQAGAESDLAPLASLAAAYLALEAGDEEGAEKAFRGLLAREGAVVPRAALKLELAGIAERAGRADEARQLLEEVLEENPDSQLGAAARQRLGTSADEGTPRT